MDEVQASLFRNSLTLGLRRRLLERVTLSRRTGAVQTGWGEVESKEVDVFGERYSRPEYESLKRLAEKTGRSVVQLRYLLGAGSHGGEGAQSEE